MAPVEDDPGMWATIIKTAREALSFVLPWLLPSLLGTLAASRFKCRRKLGFWGWVNAVFWSTVAGAGLAPLVAHISGVPESLTNSLAFLIGILGFNKTDSLRAILQARKVLKGEGGDVAGDE